MSSYNLGSVISQKRFCIQSFLLDTNTINNCFNELTEDRHKDIVVFRNFGLVNPCPRLALVLHDKNRKNLN